jgi:hypothetical protein
MEDVLVGLLAVAVGALFCFRGYLAMRIVIPIWGAFSGFVFGAGLATALTDDEFLGTVLGWGLGLLFALVFAVLAYLYYQVAVVLAFGAIGFAIGTGLMVAIGIEWNWFIVLVGLALGAMFGLAAIAGNLPMVLLIVISALGGGVILVAGAMLVFNVVDLEQLDQVRTTEVIKDEWFWYLTYVVVVVASVVIQVQSLARFTGGLREVWEGTPTTPMQMPPPSA